VLLIADGGHGVILLVNGPPEWWMRIILQTLVEGGEVRGTSAPGGSQGNAGTGAGAGLTGGRGMPAAA
jgi:hypothetical protein